MKIKFLKFIKIDLNKQYREKQRKFIESIKIIIFCFFFYNYNKRYKIRKKFGI